MKQGAGAAAIDAAGLLRRLAADGVLLVQDAELPSVATLVAGGPIKGSWWSHPQAKAIFDALDALDDHADVIIAKLVGSKTTLVHRRLWAALASVGRGRAPWQLDGLSAAARALLDDLERGGDARQGTGAAGKELDLRLLAVGRQVHTTSGKHVLEQRSWAAFAKAERVAAMPLEAAMRELDAALGDAAGRLPWHAKPRRATAKRARR